MAEFDMDGYLRRKTGSPGTDKIDALARASDEKIKALSDYRVQMEKRQVLNAGSWVNKLGLTPGSLEADTVNLAASVVAGTMRGAGDLMSLVPAAMSIADGAQLTEEDNQAVARYRQGTASPEDLALINKRKGLYTGTALELADSAQTNREIGRSLAEAGAGYQSIVQQDKKQALKTALGDGFQAAWDQTGLANLFEKDKEIGSAKDVAIGLGKLLYNAGEAAVTQPGAASEYIAENLPQLLVGGAMKGGKYALTAMNAGYAADQYQQGIQNYQAKHNGELPPPEERQRMALFAASTMLAEQVGELGQLGAIGKIRKATDLTDDAAKIGFKEALKNTGKAAVTGNAGEAVTEGWQTYAEGQAQLKPASAQDIYEGAVIGGLSGGVLSGGGRAVAEVLGATPEHVEQKAKEQGRLEAFLKSAATGDTSAYTDPTKPTYDPSTAIAVLMRNSEQEGTTEEAKQENLAKADKLLAGLEEQRAKVQEQLEAVSPETLATNKQELAIAQEELSKVDPADTTTQEQLSQKVQLLSEIIADTEKDPAAVEKDAKRLQDKLSKLDTQITEASGVRDQFGAMLQPKIDDVQLESDLTLANTEATPESQSAAERVINLSMTAPEKVTAEVALQLAENTGNALSTEQRSYLRAFSEARTAENTLKDMGKVSQEVYYGSSKNIGIAQYQKRLTTALASGNSKTASRLVDMLGSFAQNHAEKLAVATQAMAQGQGTQIIKTDAGWQIADRKYSDKELRANGGLTLNSPKLVEAISKEAKALQAASVEMQQAVALRFKVATPVAPSTVSAVQATASPTPAATTASAAPEATGELTSQVQGVESAPSTTPSENNLSVDTAEVESRPETSSELPAGTLSTLEKKTEGKTYQEKNLVADFFTQVSDAKRPLTAVKDFLSQLASQAISILDYLDLDRATDKQLSALSTFRSKATEWQSGIKDNLIQGNKRKNDPLYYYKDLMQYFINENADVDENLKTAISYAAFSFVADNATKSAFNTPAEINQILGRDEDTPVTNDEFNMFGLVGARQNVVINGLGQKVIQALGLKVSKDAPIDLMPRLESSLGAHVMKLLMDRGILQRTNISGDVMARFMESDTTNKNAVFSFLRLARDAQYKLHPEAQEISDASKGSKGALDKLFKVDAAMKEPSMEPVPFNQKTTKNTRQRVPAKLAKIVAAKNAEANFVRQDMFDLVSQLDEEVALAIAGVVEPMETTHKANRLSMDAKNDGLRREYQNFLDFVSSMEDIEAPMYFEHSVWKQQRVGIATNMVNPQTSKIHRFMLFRKAWETKVDPNNSKQVDNFKLRVLEGLGTKTDKQSNEKSLASYEAKVNSEVIQKAVAVLVSRMEGQDLTKEMQDDLVAGVKAGGEKFHSLDALMALAHEKFAKGQPFTVQMMGEIDGVTNGPMLSHLLLGAAESVKSLFGLLNRGGFFQVGSQQKQYNLWRGTPGNLDLYETVASQMTRQVSQFMASGIHSRKGKMLMAPARVVSVMTSIYAFTGELEKDGKVEKAGRNIVKQPLTAMVFGSSMKKAIDSMADKFIESIYEKLEAVAEGKADRVQVIQHLNNLGLNINPKTAAEDLLEEFTPTQIENLKRTFSLTLGNAMKFTMEQEFALFIERRSKVNAAAKMSFDLYNTVYTGLKKIYLQELVDNGTIAVDGKGNPIHDLSTSQEAELRKRVEKIIPISHTLMSKQSKDLGAGLLAAKRDRKLSTKNTFGSSIQFKNPFKDNNAFSVGTNAYETVETDPGVATTIMSIHSTDSAISHMAADGNEVLNIHDAHGSGLGGFGQTALNLNKATWDAMLEYSPAAEVADMLSRGIVGLASMLKDKAVPDEVKADLRKMLRDYAIDEEIATQDAPWYALESARRAAYNADKIKLEAMSEMGTVDQYALEGGSYTVTDEDRAAAQTKLTEIARALTLAENEALETLSQELGLDKDERETEPVVQEDTVVPSPFGELGIPAVKSDADLVAMFNKQGTMTAAQVIPLLAQKLSQGNGNMKEFNLRLLKLVQKVVNPKLTIQYVTPRTEAEAVLDMPADNSRGWYVAKNGQEQIYVLSPEFVASGLTPEVLLHELVHAAVARVIDKPTAAASELVAELNTLLGVAKKYVADNKLSQYNPAVSNVQELVAWGMSNLGFQKDVLNKINMESKTKGNALVTGMQAFINALTGLLFRSSTKTEQEKATNGMSVLISNVSGLFYQAAQAKNDQNINLSMANTANMEMMSTIDIHEALADGTLDPAFDTHLRGVLAGIVESLHGPFGTFRALVQRSQNKRPLDLYAEAKATGEVPFASAALAGNFPIKEQEAFVLEQVEVTVRTALEGNEGQTSAAYSELSRLYTETYNRLKGQTMTPEQQALFDFAFKIEAGKDKKSDYLSRFAALGLGHQTFNKMLQVDTAIDTRTVRSLPTIAEKLLFVFNKLMNFLNGKLTHTFDGQQADAKLTTLVEQLVKIENKKRKTLEAHKSRNDMVSSLEENIRDFTGAARTKLGNLGEKDFFQKSNKQWLKLMGTTMSVVGKDRADEVLDAMMQYRDRFFKERQGIIASTISEVRGLPVLFQELLRATKGNEKNRKAAITATAKAVMDSFANKGKDLKKADQEAITEVFLRTDMAALFGKKTIAEIQQLVSDPQELFKEINALENQLAQFGNAQHYFTRASKDLGYFMATGEVVNQHLMMNASNIASMYGTPYFGKLSEAQTKAATEIIDQLVSLRALQYTDKTSKVKASRILANEIARADKGNGVEMVLRMHQRLQAESKERLFRESAALMMKGYTPEIYNPNVDIRVATATEGAELEKQGYVKGGPVPRDPKDYNQDLKHIYVMRDGGLNPRLSGNFSLTSKQSRGTEEYLSQNPKAAAAFAQARDAGIREMFQAKPGYDPSKVGATYAAPVVNPSGKVVAYRYLMRASTKNNLLDRDNRFDKILGTMAGSIMDKETTAVQNKQVVEALKQFYKDDYTKHPHSYVEVSATSPDPEIREIYALLPTETKVAIAQVWGKPAMMVRRDVMDINFGYRKLSLADIFDNPTPNKAEHAFMWFTERALQIYAGALLNPARVLRGEAPVNTTDYGQRAQMVVRRNERIWQEVVREMKDIIVIKTGSVMIGNVLSNVSLLMMNGVPFKDIVKHHRVAMKAALAYQKDSNDLAQLKAKLDTGYTQGNDAEIKREIIRLEDHLARNPVKGLIDAGLMPTIVEDIAADEDIYSYKSRFTRTMDKYTSKLNDKVLSTGKLVYMTHDTTIYKTLSHVTQLSDFVARYTLYQHLTTKKDPLTSEQAVQEAADAFVNYDIPMHRTTQYMDDMGVMMFTKYFLRIQKVLLKLGREHPARVIGMMLINNYFDLLPLVTDSSALAHLGNNPFSTGAFGFPSTLDELATVNAGLGLFK